MTGASPYYDQLKGVWSFKRTIIDQRLNQTLTAQGQASFQPAETPQTLLYREEGRFNADQEFFREYIYVFDGDKITILFADDPTRGKIFQTICPGTENITDRHLCGPDCYDGRYDFQTAQCFVIAQQVTGPRKNYTMETIYNRSKTL
ncbi:MAG TPA: DUF6314 family protein [Alphaproteobacteria bacterium]